MWYLVFIIFLAAATAEVAQKNATSRQERQEREERVLSVFNVVTFPNSACGASNGYNGTCYTSSECTSKGGTASGTCASSFGVCCVFSIACGGTSSANNSYAIISSYSVSSDADPCTYSFCKANSDVCKLRIDFDIMVLSSPETHTTTNTYLTSYNVGDCDTDTLTVTNPGGREPPIICGYNTGQHMWVPASDSCNQINIDIDTGSTTTTRKWQIKVTQYECGNLMMPTLDCLQYHTSSTGSIASFNWDTSTTSIAQSQTHLSDQFYDICIRRARSYCSVCYYPSIFGTTTASSFGIGSSAAATTATAAVGTTVSGVTTISGTVASQVGYGDYLEIVAMQSPPTTSTTVTGHTRITGCLFSATAANTAPSTGCCTICSFATPFRVGVHFDTDDAVFASAAVAEGDHTESTDFSPTGGTYGFQGFYLDYFQVAC